MSTAQLEPATDQRQDTASWAAVAFIASYSSPSTRRTYTTQLRVSEACGADLDDLAVRAPALRPPTRPRTEVLRLRKRLRRDATQD